MRTLLLAIIVTVGACVDSQATVSVESRTDTDLCQPTDPTCQPLKAYTTNKFVATYPGVAHDSTTCGGPGGAGCRTWFYWYQGLQKFECVETYVEDCDMDGCYETRSVECFVGPDFAPSPSVRAENPETDFCTIADQLAGLCSSDANLYPIAKSSAAARQRLVQGPASTCKSPIFGTLCCDLVPDIHDSAWQVCVESPSYVTFPGASAVAEPVARDAVASNALDPLHWMVGTWDCGVVNYHNIPLAQTVLHQMSGVYTVTEDATGIHGRFREKDDGQFGPTDYDDEWVITPVRWANDKNWVLSTYKAHGITQQFEIESAGVVRDPILPALLGFAMFGSVSTPDMTGTVKFPDGKGGTITRGWGGVHSSAAPKTGRDAGKITFGRNWLVVISSDTQVNYIDDHCIRRPEPTSSIIEEQCPDDVPFCQEGGTGGTGGTGGGTGGGGGGGGGGGQCTQQPLPGCTTTYCDPGAVGNLLCAGKCGSATSYCSQFSHACVWQPPAGCR